MRASVCSFNNSQDQFQSHKDNVFFEENPKKTHSSSKMSFCKRLFLLCLSIVYLIIKLVVSCLLTLPIIRTVSVKWFNTTGCYPMKSKMCHKPGNEVSALARPCNGSVTPRPGILQRSDSIVHFTPKKHVQSRSAPHSFIRIQVSKSLRATKLKATQSKIMDQLEHVG